VNGGEAKPMVSGVSQGPAASTAPKMVNRCPHCMAELYEADNGYGGVRLACKTHGFDRYPIVSVPAWVEADCKRFPNVATRWLGFLLDRDFSWPADDASESDKETPPRETRERQP
jgi:hypothetical protein